MQPTRIRLHGITLVEVLMSTMVVMLGILGLISLIPLGSHLAERGTRSDRIASFGRRIPREAKAFGVLNPNAWLDPLKTPAPIDQTRFRATASSLPVRQAYLIDPMFFIDSSATRQYFPFDSSATLQMRRLTLGSYPTLATSPDVPNEFKAILSRAERAFVSDDDYGVGTAGGYERPKDRDDPLLQKYFIRKIAGTDTNIRRQSQGTYSWAIMLVPDLPGDFSTVVNITNGDKTPPFALASDAIQLPTDTYTMSTIIFHSRQGDIPVSADIATSRNERSLGVDGASFISGSGASGEVLVQSSSETDLEMKTGDWICLSVRVTRMSGGDTLFVGDVFKWYRIMAMDETYGPTSGLYSRRLTINGPDWNTGFTPTQAIYMEDVVGVYERKVRLETGSLWTP